MRRQMPDGSYRWLGVGAGYPRGVSCGHGRRSVSGPVETGLRAGGKRLLNSIPHPRIKEAK